MIRLLTIAFCLLALPAHALEVTYAAGTFTPNQTVFTASDQPVTIRCAGPQQTILIVPSGFSITYDSEFKAPTIDGCTIATDQADGGTALTITGPVLATSTQQGPHLSRLSIRGDNVQTHYWSRGVRLVNVWNPVLRDINGKGLDQATPNFLMLTCVEFEASQVVDIEKLDCYHVQTAVKQIGAVFGEGFSLRDFNFVGVNEGVLLLGGAGYIIADGHMNAADRCVELQGKSQLVIVGLLCYKTHTSTKDFVGILAVNASLLKILYSNFEGSLVASESGLTAGIVFINVFNSTVIGNSCENFKKTSSCIVIGSKSRDNQLLGNQSRTGAGLVLKLNPDAGPTNYRADNKP